MRLAISILLLCAMSVFLCACGSEPAPTTTAAPPPTTTLPDPGCAHVYADADCVIPKTCTLCGATRGSALGHDYTEGICSRCGAEDPTFVALLDGNWRTEALNEDGSQMEFINLRFADDGTAMFAAGIYDRLSDVPEDQREEYMKDENNWYDYSGEIYYYAGFGVGNTVNYSVEGNVITCTLVYDDVVEGTLILERTAGNMLTVTYFDGHFSIIYLQVGDVLCAES